MWEVLNRMGAGWKRDLWRPSMLDTHFDTHLEHGELQKLLGDRKRQQMGSQTGFSILAYKKRAISSNPILAGLNQIWDCNWKLMPGQDNIK